MRRSDDAEPRIVSEKGDHDTWKISSVWPSNEWSFDLSERRSQSATVLSAEPVARRCSENGLKARQLISLACASTTCFALSVLRAGGVAA